MNRPIKFRAWDKQFNKMIDYIPAQDDQNVLTILKGEERYVFQQFTGLLDKNGKEIYEGDWLEFNTLSGNKMIYQVRWKEKGFVPVRLSHHNQAEITVIGNIYENPDLLPSN